MTDLQALTAKGIVNVFETGHPQGGYGTVTLLRGDRGGLSYGRSQATLSSGTLHRLMQGYCGSPGARLAEQLRIYLPQLAARDPALNRDAALRALLREAGLDPVMRDLQDAFFDQHYWRPAVAAAQALGLGEPLSVAVVYDSHIHGSWARMRSRVLAEHGTPAAIGERAWVSAYVDTRRAWLQEHGIAVLRKTTYRMDCFRALIAAGNWELRLPLLAHGKRIDAKVLGWREGT